MENSRKRIFKFLYNQRIKPAEFLKNTGLKKGFVDKSHQESGASDIHLSKILAYYPEINPEWLLTGNGPMLRSIKGETEKFSNVPQPLGDTQSSSNPQESIEKPNTSFSDRLDRLFRHYNISGYRLAKELNISESTISNYRNGKSWPTVDFLKKLTKIYKDANLNWLLTGKGSMIHSPEEEIISENASQTSGEAQSQKAIAYVTDSKEKDLVMIDGLRNQIQALEARLPDRDRQIEELKVNFEQVVSGKDKQIESLERLIASKDEMLAMKEEAIKGKEATLAAKGEIIRIQSKRISELEDNRETEDLKKILGTSERIVQENTSFADIQPKDLSAKAKKGEYKV